MDERRNGAVGGDCRCSNMLVAAKASAPCAASSQGWRRCRSGPGLVAAQTLNMGVGSPVSSIDPHHHLLRSNSEVSQMLFDTLLMTDAQAQLRPGLAESWRAMGEEGWEFRLREGIRFHDGTPFTADDVAFTLERIPTITGPGASFTTHVRPVTRGGGGGFPHDPALHACAGTAAAGLSQPSADARPTPACGGDDGRFQQRARRHRHRARSASPATRPGTGFRWRGTRAIGARSPNGPV
jgi:hypothetical protein